MAELSAVVDEAHRQGLKVAVHAADHSAIQVAIEARADSIEHGNEASDDQLKSMRDKGIFFDITLTFYDRLWTVLYESSGASASSLAARAAKDDANGCRAAQRIQLIMTKTAILDGLHHEYRLEKEAV